MLFHDPYWEPYERYPSLKGAKLIAFDTETKDPELLTRGPGALRKDGYIIGFSVATDDGFCGYYPIRHAGDNVPNPNKAIKWLKDQLTLDIPKIGANLLYDLIWLKCDLGIDVKGPLWDVQIAEPLLDENRHHYTLDSIAQTWLGVSKSEDDLLYAGEMYLKLKGVGKTEEKKRKSIIKQTKGLLWKLPARYVGEYGEADARLPIDIFLKQEVALKEKGLWDMFVNLEAPLIDILFKMWLKGIPVDVDKAEQLVKTLELDYDKTIRKIKKRVGFTPEVWEAEDLGKACDKLGLEYPRTPKTNAPSFTAPWLEGQEHEFFKLLLRARQLDRAGSVYVKSKILDFEINGRLHPQFWQLKSERYGTVSGRFSSSNPNVQQVPSRGEFATLIRSIFCSEKGKKWFKADYSQQEFRIAVHYAVLMNLAGSQEALQRYTEDPNTDYHQMVADMTGMVRKRAKTLNLGLSYGMGPKKYSELYNIPITEARKYFNQYHDGLPFVKQLMDRAKNRAEFAGYVKTILGRHRNFNLFGPYKWEKGMVPKKREEAIKEFGDLPITRYFTYKAWNSIDQGSAADMIKKAMVDCASMGYIPAMQVHDELNFIDLTSTKQMKEVHDCMLNAIPLKVPNRVDCGVGKNWGELEEIIF